MMVRTIVSRKREQRASRTLFVSVENATVPTKEFVLVIASLFKRKSAGRRNVSPSVSAKADRL